jgi:protein NrfD
MIHEWGLLIVLYLFLGGLSAGLLAVSAAVTLFRARRLAGIARTGAMAAPWPVMLGAGLLVFDLGQPWYFWKLFTGLAPLSPMWLGTWIIALFSLVSVAHAATFLPAWLTGWTDTATETWRWRLASLGLPLGLSVGIYTGILLGVLIARPLWNTPLLAQLFLVSALSTACALLLVLLRRTGTAQERRALTGGDVALIAVELLVLAGMFLEAGTSPATSASGAALLLHAPYGLVFWTIVVLLGLLLPLVLELLEYFDVPHRRGWTRVGPLFAAAPALVLLGGLCLRWVIVYAGQVSHL